MANFSLLFKYNLIITLCLMFSFLSFNDNYTIETFFTTLTAAVSTTFILYVLLYLLLMIFSAIGKIGLYIISFIYISIDFLIVLNYFYFSEFNKHLSFESIEKLLDINILSYLNIEIIAIISSLMLLFAIILFQLYTISNISNLDRYQKRRENKSFNKMIFIPFILVVILDKLIFASYYMYNENEKLKYYNVIPLYEHVDLHEYVIKYEEFKKEN